MVLPTKSKRDKTARPSSDPAPVERARSHQERLIVPTRPVNSAEAVGGSFWFASLLYPLHRGLLPSWPAVQLAAGVRAK